MDPVAEKRLQLLRVVEFVIYFSFMLTYLSKIYPFILVSSVIIPPRSPPSLRANLTKRLSC